MVTCLGLCNTRHVSFFPLCGICVRRKLDNGFGWCINTRCWAFLISSVPLNVVSITSLDAASSAFAKLADNAFRMKGDAAISLFCLPKLQSQ